MTDSFVELLDILEDDLEETGFSPGANPPSKEPVFPGSLTGKTVDDLKTLYDELLSFYGFLTDKIVMTSGHYVISKARLEQQFAEATKKVLQSKLSNAEARKAYIETEEHYVAAKRDYTFLKATMTTLEERGDKIKRFMERLSRELWWRNQDGEQIKEEEAPGLSRAYKRTST